MCRLNTTHHRVQSDIYTATVNPYIPFHIRTGGLLPPKALEIPPWTIKNALAKMDVFFPCGPVLTVSGPPLKPAVRSPAPQSNKGEPGETPERKVQVQTPSVGMWTWKQHVVTDGKIKYRDVPTEGVKKIDWDDILRAKDKKPLAAIEGFLCMSRDKKKEE